MIQEFLIGGCFKGGALRICYRWRSERQGKPRRFRFEMSCLFSGWLRGRSRSEVQGMFHF